MATIHNAAAAVAALLLLASPALAGSDRAGTAAASFLTIGAGPGVLGMGGAALGRSGNLEIAGWNPGALGFVDHGAIEFAHASLDDQSMQEWAAMGGRIGRTQTHWAMSALFQNEGTFDARDASNNLLGTFNVATAAGQLQLAQGFGPHAAFGVTGKYVIDDLGPAQLGKGMTFDYGLSLRFGGLGLGLAAQNVGGHMMYASVPYPFPSSVGAGISYTDEAAGLTVATDVNVPSTSYTDVRTGVEWNWKQHVALRAGYRYDVAAPADEPLSGPTFGTGLNLRGMWLDYGFVLAGNAGGQHRLALTLHPGHMNLAPGDPFGQKQMPREFDTHTPMGPPAPPAANDATRSKH